MQTANRLQPTDYFIFSCLVGWLSEADYPVLDATFKVPHPPTRTTTRHKDIVKRRRDALASSLGPSRAPAVPVQSKEEDDDMPLRLLTRVLSATRDVLSLPEKDEFGDKVDFLAVYRFVEEKSGNAAAPVFRKEALAGDIFFIYGFSPEVRWIAVSTHKSRAFRAWHLGNSSNHATAFHRRRHSTPHDH